MSYLINNQQNLNEVIFANRNKNYGAYAIRSAYGNTVLKSLSIMAFVFGTVMSLAYYYCNKNAGPSEKIFPTIQDSLIVVEVDTRIHENKKTSEATATAETSKKTVDNTNNSTIIDSTTVRTQSVEIDPTVTSNNSNGTSTTTGLPDTGGGGNTTNTLTSKGGGKGVEENYGVDSQPEFEGGLKALYQFVSKNVRYPAIASEYGKQGTVYVKFVVDENGKVGQLNLLNNAGFGMDEEALRVIAMIPNFKTPAKIKGEAVKVYYQLPIKFTLH